MPKSPQPLNILMIGVDDEVQKWFKSAVKLNKLPWEISYCSPMRLAAPEVEIRKQDFVIIDWVRIRQMEMTEILTRKAPGERSAEGVLCEIETLGGEGKLRRTIVFGKDLQRPDLTYVAEMGLKIVYPLSTKRSQWDDGLQDLFAKIQSVHNEELNGGAFPEEQAARKFLDTLKGWSRISDETKMKSSEDLLKILGDSARYAELIARKCLTEGDDKGAEQWLTRAIGINPNYLKAMQLLADLYLSSNRPKEALQLLEKLKANTPRNIQRLNKIGQCYLLLGELNRAEKAFEDALLADEFHNETRQELGKIKFLLKDYEASRTLLANAKNLRDVATFLNKVGVQFVEEKRFEDSIKHYKLAQFVLPGNESSHYLFLNMSLAYAKWGKWAEALSYANLALVREPSYEKAQSLVKQLQLKLSA